MRTKLFDWHQHKWEKRPESGQAMVEFAFAFIIFIAVLMGLVAFAIVFFMYASISHGAQEGSRHLLAHPLLPGDDSFASADEEAEWIVHQSTPMLDPDLMQVFIEPPVEDRTLGTYVAVRVTYDVPLPVFEVPLLVNDDTLTIVPPIQLSAQSRRALNWH